MYSFINVFIIIFFCVCLKEQLYSATTKSLKQINELTRWKYEEDLKKLKTFLEARIDESQHFSPENPNIAIRTYFHTYMKEMEPIPPYHETLNALFEMIQGTRPIEDYIYLDDIVKAMINEIERFEKNIMGPNMISLRTCLEEKIDKPKRLATKNPYKAVMKYISICLKYLNSPHYETVFALFDYLSESRTPTINVSPPDLAALIKAEIDEDEKKRKIPIQCIGKALQKEPKKNDN